MDCFAIFSNFPQYSSGSSSYYSNEFYLHSIRVVTEIFAGGISLGLLSYATVNLLRSFVESKKYRHMNLE